MTAFPLLIILIVFWGFFGSLMKAVRNRAGQQTKRTRPSSPPPAEAPAEEGPGKETADRHPRLTPTVHLTGHNDSLYQGSLNAVTGEGFDPCHDEQLSTLNTAEHTLPPQEQDQARLPFGWTGNDIVRGVVMSEILKRKR